MEMKLLMENWNSFIELAEADTDDRVYLFENGTPSPSDSVSFSKLHERMLSGKLTEQKLYETWEASLEYEIRLLEEEGILKRAAGALKKGAGKAKQVAKNALKRIATFLYNKLIAPMIKMIVSAKSVASIQKALNWIKGIMGSGSVNEAATSGFMKHPFIQKYGKFIIAGLVLIAASAAVYIGCSEALDFIQAAGNALTPDVMDQIAQKSSEITHVVEAAVEISSDAGCGTCANASQKLLGMVESGASMSDVFEAAQELSSQGENQMTSALEQAVQMLGDAEEAGKGSADFQEWKDTVNGGKEQLQTYASQKAQILSQHPNAGQASEVSFSNASQAADAGREAVAKRASKTDW